MPHPPNPETRKGGLRWSIYDGQYDAAANPPQPEVIAHILSSAEEPYYSEEMRRRIVMGGTAMYALLLCNLGLAANDEISVGAQKEIGSQLMQLNQAFSETDTKTREEADSLDLPEPPSLAALADMQEQQMINSYEYKLLRTVLIRIAINQKKDFDLRVIREAFGYILSQRAETANAQDSE